MSTSGIKHMLKAFMESYRFMPLITLNHSLIAMSFSNLNFSLGLSFKTSSTIGFREGLNITY